MKVNTIEAALVEARTTRAITRLALLRPFLKLLACKSRQFNLADYFELFDNGFSTCSQFDGKWSVVREG
jgi:hypothetical protein